MKTYRNISDFGLSKLNPEEGFPTSDRGSFFGAATVFGALQVEGSFFSGRDTTGFVS